ncbi:FAD:protein FMN transferase [bacterium]|nr:FAD:protein FMN transferase [bacterium]
MRFSHLAMATQFEIYIVDADAAYAGQASQAAFAELDRLENELSRFLPNSDISRINHMQPGQQLVIGPDAMACLKASFRHYLETEGAFDITVGALYECWLHADKSLRHPSPMEIKEAGRKTGLHHLFFDEAKLAVTKEVAGLQIDLGAFGKGYAVDKMAEVLSEWGIDTALIHGGASSVYARGGKEGWQVTISHPLDHARILRRLALKDLAISGSGLQKCSHIIDPVHGRPAHIHSAAWAIAPDAAASDALSTAFMVMSTAQIESYCENHPQVAAALLPFAAYAGLTTLNFNSFFP